MMLTMKLLIWNPTNRKMSAKTARAVRVTRVIHMQMRRIKADASPPVSRVQEDQLKGQQKRALGQLRSRHETAWPAGRVVVDGAHVTRHAGVRRRLQWAGWWRVLDVGGDDVVFDGLGFYAEVLGHDCLIGRCLSGFSIADWEVDSILVGMAVQVPAG